MPAPSNMPRASAVGTYAGLNAKGSGMKEINDEIKQTLNLMQTDIDDGAHNELQFHLYNILDMKRDRLVTKTGLQAELERERERERRFEGNRTASAEHREDLECLLVALENIADLELPSTDGITDFGIGQDRWRKFCEAQGIAESALAQYRKEPVTHDQAPYKSVKLEGQIADEAKPLTAEDLKAGGWWCADVSKECADAFKSKGLRVLNSDKWTGDGEHSGCAMDDCGSGVTRCFFDFIGLKQIHRIGNEFYWGEK